MKSDTTNTLLTFTVGALAVLGVIFTLRTMSFTREFHNMQQATMQCQNALAGAQAVANETAAYNQKNPNPELTRILQSVQAGRPVGK